MSNGMAKASLMAALLLAAAHLHAAEPACGTYRNEGRALVIDSASQAREFSAGNAPRNFVFQSTGAELRMTDLDTGHTSTYKVRDGNRIADDLGMSEYVLSEPATCKPAPQAAPAGTCRADLAACTERAYDADEATLRRWCDVEGLPFACDKLIDLYQQQAATRSKPEPEIEPAVCVEGTPAYSEQACMAAAKEAFGQALVEALGSMQAEAVPLAAGNLDHAAAMCTRSGSAKVCNNAAGKLWAAGRYLQARDALQLACDQGRDPEACKQVEPLAALRDQDLQPAPSTQLPCGDYAAATGLMSELKFGDRGIVEGVAGSRMRARLENGLVRMRHDKGGDFVLRVLDEQRMLGVDDWNEFALYQRQGGADRCSAPVVYAEKPLQQDCPAIMQEGGAQACCDAGKLQGCNALGHQHALADDWAGARPYYQKICANGVRAGCENLTQVYANAGDDAARTDLEQLCAKDPQHVACDVLDTANWEALTLGQAMQQMTREIEAGQDAEAGAGSDTDDAQ